MPNPSTLGNIPEIVLGKGEYVAFASDFHLDFTAIGLSGERERERKIVRWMEEVASGASAVFLLGDIFEFWIEYRFVVPRGFVRFLGGLAQLSDKGVPVYALKGNHDMWMGDFFKTELGISLHADPVRFTCGGKRFLVGHGDGLGNPDRGYRLFKYFLNLKLARGLSRSLHPNLTFRIARSISSSSKRRQTPEKKRFRGKEGEHLFQYCQQLEALTHHDYYIFGHRHLSLRMRVNKASECINLGDWLKTSPYALFDGKELEILEFA